MGSCLSCFRGEKEATEREPLLPKVAPPPSTPRSLRPLDKAVDVLAASQSGKLPSQDQLSIILRLILSSSFLQPDLCVSGSGPLSQNGRRVLNDIREFLESLLQFGMEKNMDNKFQDLLYQCSQIEGSPICVDADAAIEAGQGWLVQLHAQVPAHNELTHDATVLVRSLKSIAQLLFTSSAFRLLLCDMFASARDLLSQVAADIGNVALQVQVAAEGVERLLSVRGDSVNILAEKAEDAAETVLEGLNEAEKRPSKQANTKDVFVTRVQAFIVRAHQDPRSLDALRTMLCLTRKYAGKLLRLTDIIEETQTACSTGTDASPAIPVTPIPDASQALDDLKILLERLASGHSLDSLLSSLEDTVNGITERPPFEADSESGDLDIQQYLNSVNHWLSRALSPSPASEPLYASSRAGTRALEDLYDGGHILFLSSSASSPASVWINHLEAFLVTYDAYITALTHDRTTLRLVNALSATYADLSEFMAQALELGAHVGRRAKVWKEDALRDLVGWVIPRIMGMIGRIAVPMPRIEYKGGKTEGALDALRMGPGEPGGLELDLVPDAILVKIFNEMRIYMNPEDVEGTARASSSSRIQVRVDGIRLSVKGLGYYYRHGGTVMGYADQGLLSVDVGSSEQSHYWSSQQGLSLDIDVALDTGNEPDTNEDLSVVPSPNALFEIVDVRASLPGVRLKIDKSRHWILNKILVQPLAGPVVARVVSGVLEARIRALLEGLATGLGAVREEAQRIGEARSANGIVKGCGVLEQEPTIADYWAALLGKGPEVFGLASAVDGQGLEAPDKHTNTTATLKGVVHTTTEVTTLEQPDSGAPLQDQSETKTSVAIGAGPILFPDEAGPYLGDEEGGGAKAPLLARVVGGLDETLASAEETVAETVDSAVELRDDIERAEERRQKKEEQERSRGGWRSRAFDI